MCGIAGLHLYDQPVRRADLEAMTSTMVHRGPDGEGILVDGSWGLGMRRLAIIDLQGGWQPIGNETGRIQVVQNGEIYNYRQLRQELESLGHRFRTQSDTEVLVHAFEQWGGWEFAKHLRGMFAVAVWDADEPGFWLVRDRLGIKPLYYYEGPQGFACASEVKALSAVGQLQLSADPGAIADYLAFGSAGPGRSFLQNVLQLPPGCVLHHSGHRCQIRSYWEYPCPDQPITTDPKTACALVRESLADAVASHMVSDVPVGAFLSGGIDSSAVVGLMTMLGGRKVHTFSIGFDELPYNELGYAQQVADRWAAEHHVAVVRPDAVAIADRLVEHLDEPLADASAIPMWYVAELAANYVKVVLSGDGGDELFGGYTRYRDAWSHRWLDALPLAPRRWGASASRLLPAWCPGKYFLDYAARDAAARYSYNLDLFPLPLRCRLLRPEWHPAALGNVDPYDQRLDALNRCRDADLLARLQHLDTVHYLPMDILVKVDRMTMAHSLEARPPLLDTQLVELAANLPSSLKISPRGELKRIFKQAVGPWLPDTLLDRKKAGFSVPLKQWFAGPLRDLFHDLVLDSGHCQEYLDRSVLVELVEENRRGRRDHGLRMWAILILEKWLRRMAEVGTPAGSSARLGEPVGGELRVAAR